MTSTATRPSQSTGLRSRRQRRGEGRRRRWPLFVVLGVLLVALVVGGLYLRWLVTGLLDSSRVVQDKAAVAQAELQAFRETLKAGDEVAAQTHLTAAEEALREAGVAAQADQVRTAKGLPYVGNTVNDLDHLLAAANLMTGSANDALSVYGDFSGEDSNLFNNGKFSIPAIRSAQKSVAAIRSSMDRAEAELRLVQGKGPKGDEALAKKRTGLAQIESLRAEIVPLEPVLKALPSAVGADGRKTYLIAVMNPAEMRASGGAPLSVAFVRFKQGDMTIPLKGTTSQITLGSPEGLQGDSPELVWKRVPGDPFQPKPGEPQRFVNAGFNPDFPMSAEQMRRATKTFFGYRTDGVIALDVVAISHLLRLLGPIESPYGVLTADNLVKEVLVDAYKEQGTDIVGRQQQNDQLMSVMLSNLMGGGGMIGKAEALALGIPGRHLQMYFRDDRLQQLVETKRLGGEVPLPDVGNLSAVYTQNGNGSKLDIFQRRVVEEVVKLRDDGSAVVERTVILKNRTPEYVGIGPDPRRGYTTRWATNLVINLMPPGAKVLDEPRVTLRSTAKKGSDQDGRTFAQAAVQLRPGGKAELTWRYEVPEAATRHGDAWRLLNYVAPQGLIETPKLKLRVIAPPGWTAEAIQPTEGWRVAGDRAAIDVPMDQLRVLKVQVSPR